MAMSYFRIEAKLLAILTDKIEKIKIQIRDKYSTVLTLTLKTKQLLNQKRVNSTLKSLSQQRK